MRFLVVVLLVSTHMRQVWGKNAIFLNIQNLASEALEARRRRDDELSAVSITQMCTGLILMFAPKLLLGAEREGSEIPAVLWSSSLELFVSYKFYERLIGRLFGIEAFAQVGEARERRARKRGTSLALFGAAIGTARFSVRSHAMLGPKLYLGTAAARTFTALADHIAAEIARELAIRRAMKAVISWDDPEHSEYAQAACVAVRKAVSQKEALKPAIEAPPLIQIIVALIATSLSLRLVGTWSRIPHPTLLAPCVLGSFELARGGRAFFRANEFIIAKYIFRWATYLVIKLERPFMILISFLLDLIGRLGSFLEFFTRIFARGFAFFLRLFENFQYKLFHNQYAIYDFFHKTPGLKQSIALAWRVLRFPKFIARSYSRAVKRAQKIVKSFLWEYHDVLWPYAIAWSAYKFRTGQISFFPGIPKFLAYLAALPTVKIAQLSAHLVNLLRQFTSAALLTLAHATLNALPFLSDRFISSPAAGPTLIPGGRRGASRTSSLWWTSTTTNKK
mmetsp:Transcript_14297/g.21562  ORF Transcript_14297/g.21562 Transcript_14297/m.21562 type:complete len:507 (+) Transcript_14297:177-1697(+)